MKNKVVEGQQMINNSRSYAMEIGGGGDGAVGGLIWGGL